MTLIEYLTQQAAELDVAWELYSPEQIDRILPALDRIRAALSPEPDIKEQETP